MSELTQCNFCTLQDIRADARREHKRVTLLPGALAGGGIDVFVHPRSVMREELKTNRARYFRAWFMELGDQCCC